MTYRQILDDYIEAWNAQNISAICQYFTDDVQYTDQAVGKTFDFNSVQVFLDNFIRNYSEGFNVDITYFHENTEAETLAYEWDVSGTSKAGAKMSIQGATMIKMRGEKILNNVDYWNLAHSPKHQNSSKKGK